MGTVVRGYKTELNPNNAQRTAFMKHAGTARFAYNWGLARSQEIYCPTGKRPTAIELHQELKCPEKDGLSLDVLVQQVCSPRGTARPRRCLYQLLSHSSPQEAGQTQRQVWLSQAQET